MKIKLKAIFLTLVFLAILGAFVLYLATQDIAILNPKGIVALKEKDLIITAFCLMLIVVIPVFVLTFWFAWTYRQGNKRAKHHPDWEHNYIVEYCWWGIPVLIIIVLSVITWKSSHELNPYTPLKSNKNPIRIQVVALDWKWLFLYPDEGVASINYIQFPSNRPLNFEITADAPMNSFWIPKLGGQIYAMPAMRTKLHLMASEEGMFRGLSANISGKGFAEMTFQAVSSTDEAYRSWIESVKQSSKELNVQEYARLLKPTTNNPVELFTLSDRSLFDQIIMKYMTPHQK